jgi:hypothetical protein
MKTILIFFFFEQINFIINLSFPHRFLLAHTTFNLVWFFNYEISSIIFCACYEIELVKILRLCMYNELNIFIFFLLPDAISENQPRVIDDSRARKLAVDLKRCAYYETCATYGLNVERVFQDGNFFKYFVYFDKFWVSVV